MAEDFGKDVGLMSEVIVTGRKVGAGREFWAKLAHDENLFRQLMSVSNGLSEIRPIQHLIDLDADPFVPQGWEVVKHVKGGQFQFDQTKVKLWLADEQKVDMIKGDALRPLVAKHNPFNANLLDWYLRPENQKFIPEEWKRQATFFWGTEYRGRDGLLYVRSLYWSRDRWYRSCRWRDGDWNAADPALVPASV